VQGKPAHALLVPFDPYEDDSGTDCENEHDRILWSGIWRGLYTGRLHRCSRAMARSRDARRDHKVEFLKGSAQVWVDGLELNA
jgi:hypothetical protein